MLKELEFPFDSSYLIKKKKSLRRLLLENENQNQIRRAIEKWQKYIIQVVDTIAQVATKFD